jgi:non-heme chloroperoxidase
VVAQVLAGRGLPAVMVAVGPGVFRGVVLLPGPVLRGVGLLLVSPRIRGRAVMLTLGQFGCGWANAPGEKEAKQLYDRFGVAGPGVFLVRMGNATLNPWTQARAGTAPPGRGPLLISGGERDHTVAWAIARAACQRRNWGVRQIVRVAGRGRWLRIGHGWREVARAALDFAGRFAG